MWENIFSKPKVKQSRIKSGELLESIIEKDNEKILPFVTAADKEVKNSGTCIEIFTENNKNPQYSAFGINGNGVELQVTDEIKKLLQSPKTKIVKSQVTFKENDPTSSIKRKIKVGEYFLNPSMTFNSAKEGELVKLVTKPAVSAKTNQQQKPQLFTIYNSKELFQEKFPSEFISGNPFRTIYLIKNFVEKLNPDQTFVTEFFKNVLSKDETSEELEVISNNRKKPHARELLENFNKQITDIEWSYRQGLGLNRHKKIVASLAKAKMLSPTRQAKIKLDEGDITVCIEYCLSQKHDFKMAQWNRDAVDEKTVLEYIANRRSLYNIQNRKRTYSPKEIINGTKNTGIECKIKEYVGNDNFKKLKSNTQGLVEKFNHNISLSTFYSYVKQLEK